jgi:hypothetical protein
VVEAAGVSLTTGRQHSAADGARAHVASGGACANAGASRARVYATEKRVLRWSRDANGEDKISLSFLFFFLEKPHMPMRGEGLWAGPQPS